MREDIRFVLKLRRGGRDTGAWRASLGDLRSAHTHVFRSIGSSHIVDHRDVGLYVHGDPAVIDLGTAVDPGLNVLTGSARYHLRDARPSDGTVVITVGGTVLGDEVAAAGSAGPARCLHRVP